MLIGAAIRDIESGKGPFEKENVNSSPPLMAEYDIPHRETSRILQHIEVIRAGRVLMGRSLVCPKRSELNPALISQETAFKIPT